MVKGKHVFAKLKFKAGGHRVQRVPETESQGRVHCITKIEKRVLRYY